MQASISNILRTTFRFLILAAMVAATPEARGQVVALPTGGPTTRPATMALKRYVIKDDQMFKTVVFQGIMPADWAVKGGIIWKMNLGMPDLLRVHWGDARDVCAFDVYPYLTFYWSQQAQGASGQTYMGSVVMEPPTDQFDAIAKVIIPLFRPELANAQVVNQQKLPDVAKAEYAQLTKGYSSQVYAANVWAGSETFEYEMQGQTVQEIVTLTLDETLNRRFGNRGWSISGANSVRAPKGALNQLVLPRAVIFQSLQANPDWNKSVADFINKRQQQQAANQANQFNQIESRIATQTQANDQQHQAFDQHVNNLNRQEDAEADVQREVSPWKDNDGTSYKLPTQYSYAWSGADGRIIMNNDPQYNPNSDPNLTPTNWTPMQQSGN